MKAVMVISLIWATMALAGDALAIEAYSGPYTFDPEFRGVFDCEGEEK